MNNLNIVSMKSRFDFDPLKAINNIFFGIIETTFLTALTFCRKAIDAL